MSKPELIALEGLINNMTPSFHISEDMLEEVKKWKTGSKYHIQIEVKQVGKREEAGEPVEARFEVLKAKAIEDMEEEEEVSYIDKRI